MKTIILTEEQCTTLLRILDEQLTIATEHVEDLIELDIDATDGADWVEELETLISSIE